MEIKYLYNYEKGRVEEWRDDVLSSLVLVRAGMEEAVILEAVIAELERKGYRVIKDDGKLTWDIYGAAR